MQQQKNTQIDQNQNIATSSGIIIIIIIILDVQAKHFQGFRDVFISAEVRFRSIFYLQIIENIIVLSFSKVNLFEDQIKIYRTKIKNEMISYFCV